MANPASDPIATRTVVLRHSPAPGYFGVPTSRIGADKIRNAPTIDATSSAGPPYNASQRIGNSTSAE